MTAGVVYAIALALRGSLETARVLRTLVLDTIPWFGAILAAAYAALYARFSAQWSYLADVYNQIKAAECAGGKPDALAEWKAAFMEDAAELHLDNKPVFATVIQVWGKEPGVKEAFVKYGQGGEKRFAGLMRRTSKASKKRSLPEKT
jgi:hypothetical protein